MDETAETKTEGRLLHGLARLKYEKKYHDTYDGIFTVKEVIVGPRHKLPGSLKCRSAYIWMDASVGFTEWGGYSTRIHHA